MDQIITALTEHLRWHRRRAIEFAGMLTESECDDILEHVRQSRQPIVGVAAVVYRARLRMAGDDPIAKQRAAAEAGEHYKLIPIERAVRNRCDCLPDRQEKAPARVAERGVGARRREFDNH